MSVYCPRTCVTRPPEIEVLNSQLDKCVALALTHPTQVDSHNDAASSFNQTACQPPYYIRREQTQNRR
jgi:hypothetical protein